VPDISLPLHAPDYYRAGEIGDWNTTIYLNYESPFIPFVNRRIFLLRKEAVIFDENATWESIVSYFNNHLNDLGWIRSETYAPCQMYFPEKEYLSNGKEGYVYYRRENYQPLIDYDEEDLICLAIWKPEGQETFNIVFLTARPSLFYLISKLLSI